MIDNHQNMVCRKGFNKKAPAFQRLESKCGKPLSNSNGMRPLIFGTKRFVLGTESDSKVTNASFFSGFLFFELS
jgi:hypothetical protein